ncbi:hypothetical protein LV469_01325 [Peptoniphilus sp. GNH]|nr:hypothetical protein LV469_01325 [Peptoniphilus sp. GNH]
MGLLEKLLSSLKGSVINAIINNFTLASTDGGMLSQVTDIARADPRSYNSDLFSIAQNVNRNVIVPVAMIIITFIAISEIYALVIEKNNMHDFDTFVFFKWIVKTYLSIYLVNHSFDFIMAIFSISQNMVGQVSGATAEAINTASNIEAIRANLEKLSFFELASTYIQTLIPAFIIRILYIAMWVITLGRMAEIYFVISVSSLPFATLTSGRFSGVGDNYIKTSVALGLQGLFMIMTIAFYSTFVERLAVDPGTDMVGFLGKAVGASLLAVIVLLRTKSIAMSVTGAS